MQPYITPVRDTLTSAAVIALIRDSTAVTFAGGCELLTGMDLLLAEDITDDLVNGSVSRAAYADLHGSASLRISRDLPFGNALLRPYIMLSDGVTEARFNLGVYFADTPARDLSEFPISYSVECQDILAVLDDAVGDAYAVAKGANYLDAVESILLARGVVRYSIDRSSSAVLPTDRVWMFDEQTTWLTIVNDLLGAIGYAGIWSDWDGALRCGRYISPRDRSTEWTYDTQPLTSMLGNRSTRKDFYDAPNRWVFYRTNNIDGPAPTEGAGVYTYVNNYLGETSVEARGGREITKVVGIDAADQDSLVLAAQRTIDADSAIPTKIVASTFPNPLHWHFDVLRVEDDRMGVPAKVLGSQWTLQLDGGDMGHEWSVIQ